MHPELKKELYKSHFQDVPGLIEYLFPDEVLPLPLDKLAESLTNSGVYCLYNTISREWKGVPHLERHSSCRDGSIDAARSLAMTAFLNTLGARLRESCERIRPGVKLPTTARVWSSSNRTRPLPSGPSAYRPPDLTLGDGNTDLEHTWETTMVVAALESNPGDYKKAMHRLTDHAYMTFSSQDERRFALGVSFSHRDLRVYVFDRAGMVGAVAFDFCKEPKPFLRVLAGLTLAAPSVIGYDPTVIHRGPFKTQRFVRVAGEEYELVQRMFLSDMIRGGGTVCWRARRTRDGAEYAIKDTWTDVSRLDIERRILREGAGLEGVTRIVADEIVMLAEDRQDSTGYLRAIIDKASHPKRNWLPAIEVRAHRRIVSTPCAEELSFFSSKKELLSVFIDAIRTHERLIEKNILHRDVSGGNILMYKPLHSSEDDEDKSVRENLKTDLALKNNRFRRGLLIDLDNAKFLTDKGEDNAKVHGRTGTVPFMAIELLMGKQHQPRHDLESFFYVLLWICWHYKGPNNLERDFDYRTSHAGRWCGGDTYDNLGLEKGCYFEREHIFEDYILSMNAPYFDDLKPCLRKLRSIIYNQETRHEDVVKILEEQLRALPEDENFFDNDEELALDEEEDNGTDDGTDEDEDEDEEQETLGSSSGKRAYETMSNTSEDANTLPGKRAKTELNPPAFPPCRSKEKPRPHTNATGTGTNSLTP